MKGATVWAVVRGIWCEGSATQSIHSTLAGACNAVREAHLREIASGERADGYRYSERDGIITYEGDMYWWRIVPYEVE